MRLFSKLETTQYSGKKALIGLSGGINSAAVLCYLATQIPKNEHPSELHLFYAHFAEHSLDTYSFVLACVDYARKHFDKVVFEVSNNSVLEHFREQKMIYHPMLSGCTRMLKIIPMAEYAARHGIEYDLVGYVREEARRIKRQLKSKRASINKIHPISHLYNEECFALVKQEIGWYPAIYDIKWNDPRLLPFLEQSEDLIPAHQYKKVMRYAVRGENRNGNRRVFAHNNCLPCKNMQSYELLLLKLFYPAYYTKAIEAAKDIGSHFGRKEDRIEDSSCNYCKF